MYSYFGKHGNRIRGICLIGLCAFILIAGVPIPAEVFSQNTGYGYITGKVYDEATHKPLADANILVVQLKVGTTAGGDGVFSISGIPEGNYTLEVSFLGYKKFERKIGVRSGSKSEVNISLKPEAFTNKEVVISADRNHEERYIPMRVNLIPAKEIKQTPVVSVPQILDYLPGINMSNTFGIFSGKAVVTMHGLPANDQSRTLVLLDGVPMNKADEGSVNWNMINKNNIESIKVIKGPGPAQYGGGAMGGVIEIASKKPSKKIEGEAAASFGTYNTMEGNIDVSGSVSDSSVFKGLYWNLSSLGRKSDGYITEPDEYYEVWDTILTPVFLKELNTSAKIGYAIDGQQNAEVKLSYYDDKRGNGVRVFENFGAYSEHDTYSASGKYVKNGRRSGWLFNFFYTHEQYHRMYEYMREGEYQLYEADSKRKDLGGKFSLSFLNRKFHNLKTGLEYKLGSVDGTDTYYTSTDIIYNAGNMQTGAFFIQDETFLLNRKLQVNVGMRYDLARYNNGSFAIDYPSYSIEFYDDFEDRSMPARNWSAFCPRLSAQYLLSENERFYLSFAKGFRAPILDDMTRTGKKKGTFKVANPDLQPEIITSLEGGADITLFKRLSLCSSVFYNLGKDFMYLSSTGDSVNMGYKIVPVLKMKNIGRVEIYGLECELKGDLTSNIRTFVNYTYTHAIVRENIINDPAVDFDLKGKYLTDVPDHKVSAGFSWNNRIVNTTVRYKYIGRQWINDLNIVDEEYLLTDRYPAYSVFSLRFERRIYKNLKAALNIENILNRKYTDSNAQQCPGRFITVSLIFALN